MPCSVAFGDRSACEALLHYTFAPAILRSAACLFFAMLAGSAGAGFAASIYGIIFYR